MVGGRVLRLDAQPLLRVICTTFCSFAQLFVHRDYASHEVRPPAKCHLYVVLSSQIGTYLIRRIALFALSFSSR